MGLTTSGSIGAQTAMSLDDAVKLTSDSKFAAHYSHTLNITQS